jgi:hypothetical protein
MGQNDLDFGTAIADDDGRRASLWLRRGVSALRKGNIAWMAGEFLSRIPARSPVGLRDKPRRTIDDDSTPSPLRRLHT